MLDCSSLLTLSWHAYNTSVLTHCQTVRSMQSLTLHHPPRPSAL